MERLLTDGLIPVVSSIARSTEDTHVYNVNVDTVAAALATALRASRFLPVTDFAGLHANWPHTEGIHERLTAKELETCFPICPPGCCPGCADARTRYATECAALTSSYSGPSSPNIPPRHDRSARRAMSHGPPGVGRWRPCRPRRRSPPLPRTGVSLLRWTASPVSCIAYPPRPKAAPGDRSRERAGGSCAGRPARCRSAGPAGRQARRPGPRRRHLR
ncbi:amino acid kinase family protein [Streptomyces klenkii]|uniref:amino acid kinase family protein n=1 Tax=Streptomyces klenkii TaxID=1420899 RepID=UPI003F68981A